MNDRVNGRRGEVEDIPLSVSPPFCMMQAAQSGMAVLAF
jgi:hypothetical protein